MEAEKIKEVVAELESHISFSNVGYVTVRYPEPDTWILYKDFTPVEKVLYFFKKKGETQHLIFSKYTDKFATVAETIEKLDHNRIFKDDEKYPVWFKSGIEFHQVNKYGNSYGSSIIYINDENLSVDEIKEVVKYINDEILQR